MFFFLFPTVALANPHLDLGDRLWCQGSYRDARKSWQQATNDPHPATQAMANYRLLLNASNIGWVYYGFQGDRHLLDCSTDEPICALANVDRELFLSKLQLPSDLDYAEELAEQLLPYFPAEATARLVWLGQKEQRELDQFSELDGIGHCLQQQDSWPSGPGGAYYGFGLYGGGRLGVGASASWSQPNVDGKGGQLQLSAAATNQQAGGFYVSYSSAGEKWIRWRSNIQRRPFFRYVNDEQEFHLIDLASLSIAPGMRWDNGFLWLGAHIRWDDLSNPQQSIGPIVGWRWQLHPTVQWEGDILYTWTDYQYLRIDNQIKWIHPSGVAAMATLYAAPNDNAPWWRLPTVGGGNILRTAPAHRWRDPYIPSAVVEYRWRSQETIGVVGFGEVAYAESEFHGGGGLGLRIRMPPQPFNTIRFDVGYGDSGWNVLFGAEEFFRF